MTPDIESQQAIALAVSHFGEQHAGESLPVENESVQLMVRLDDNQQAQLVYLVDFLSLQKHLRVRSTLSVRKREKC